MAEHNALVLIFRDPVSRATTGYMASCPACGWDGHELMAAEQWGGAPGLTNQLQQAQLKAQREAERHNGFTASGLLLPPGVELPKEIYEP